MSLRINKREYMQLIEEDLKYLNQHCEEGSPEKDHIRVVLCSSIDRLYPQWVHTKNGFPKCDLEFRGEYHSDYVIFDVGGKPYLGRYYPNRGVFISSNAHSYADYRVRKWKYANIQIW